MKRLIATTILCVLLLSFAGQAAFAVSLEKEPEALLYPPTECTLLPANSSFRVGQQCYKDGSWAGGSGTYTVDFFPCITHDGSNYTRYSNVTYKSRRFSYYIYDLGNHQQRLRVSSGGTQANAYAWTNIWQTLVGLRCGLFLFLRR